MVQMAREVIPMGSACAIAPRCQLMPTGPMPAGQASAIDTYGIASRWQKFHANAGQIRQPKGPAGGEPG
jgi:hypothetical protein